MKIARMTRSGIRPKAHRNPNSDRVEKMHEARAWKLADSEPLQALEAKLREIDATVSDSALDTHPAAVAQ